MSEYLPPPPHYFHKGRSKWWKKTDAERQKFTDNYNKRIAAKEALIKQRSTEATVNGLSPEAEAKWKELRYYAHTLSASDTSDKTNVSQNVEDEKKESKQVAIGYKSYEQRMTRTEAVPCDLDDAVKKRLLMMHIVRNGLWE
jgi:phosphopantetheinyl transferase (holo-ACP synthase)